MGSYLSVDFASLMADIHSQCTPLAAPPGDFAVHIFAGLRGWVHIMEKNMTAFPTEIKSEHCPSLLAGIVVPPPDAGESLLKRSCPRWAFAAPAELRYQALDGTRKTVECYVRDLSEGGIGLQCKEPVPVNARGEIFVFFEDRRFQDSVRVAHATRSIGSYKVGCQFISQLQATETSVGGS